MDQDPEVVASDATPELQPVPEAQNRRFHYSLKTIIAAIIAAIFFIMIGVVLAKSGLFLNSKNPNSLIPPISDTPGILSVTPTEEPRSTPTPVPTQTIPTVVIIQSTIPPSYPTTSSNGCPRTVEPPCTNDKLPPGCGYSAMPNRLDCPGGCPIICN